MLRRLPLIVLFIWVTWTLSSLTLAQDATDEPAAASADRFATVQLEAVPPSRISGTFTAHDNGDGTTSLEAQLDTADPFNPWGIFALSDCQKGVAVNQRPVFTLPDIENGHKEEIVETATYASFPDSLSVVIYAISPDGSQHIAACSTLGPPSASPAQTTTTPVQDCATPPVISLEGDWLAVSAQVNGNGDIYLVNLEDALHGTGAETMKRLTTAPVADFDPTWSPDGSRLAFRTQRDGNDEIYVMNADGSCQVNLTDNPLGDWSPAWSPDGEQIAFAHFFDNNTFTDIAVMNADGSGLQRLTTESGEYPAWSADGKHIAFASARTGNYEIFVMNADGSDQVRLTDNPAYDMSPAWSPDGKHIAFDTQRDFFPPQETGIGPEFEIHVMNADGSGDTRLTDNHEEDRFPTWTPDNRIIYSHNGLLWLMDADGSQPISLNINASFADFRPIHR